MKRIITAALILLVVTSAAHAGIITLANDSLDTILNGNATAIGSPEITDMVNVNGSTAIEAEVANQAYTDGNGLYAYLYQVENTGSTAIEMYTLWPFLGANDNTVMGWLSDATAPDGFADGGQIPESIGYISNDGSGEVISFYYGKRYGNEISPSENSAVMYVLSDQSPEQITGNIIGGNVGTGQVVGAAVPEPTTILYLVLGGLSLLGLQRRR